MVERAPAHEGQGCDLDLLTLKGFLHLVVAHQVVERVVQWAQVGVHLLRQVAGEKAQAFAGLHRRAGEHDALHRAALERIHRTGHGEIRLAGAGRADAEGDVVCGHVFQVAGLVGRAALHLATPGLHGERFAAHFAQGGVAAEHELNLFGWDGAARHLVQGLQGFERLLRLGFGAFDAELLETVRDLDLTGRLDGADVRVHGTAQVAHAGVVGRREGVSENQTDNPVKVGPMDGARGIPQ